MNSKRFKCIMPLLMTGNVFLYRFLYLIIPVMVILSGGFAYATSPLPLSDQAFKVAIDPGHGGADNGAQGPTGQLEKNITLESVQKLTLKLEPDYQVVLTRSDDYRLTPHQRTAIVNQAKADVFISIHTGAGFLHRTNTITVFYYTPFKSGIDLSADKGGSDDKQRWDQTQKRHQEASTLLASALTKNLNKMEGTADCKMMGAPLVLLEGADMPAVMIEVGHITHPATEKKLSSPQGIELLVGAIEQGIRDFTESFRKP